MNIQVIKAAWRRWRKPSSQTLKAMAQCAKADYWLDYQPRDKSDPMASLDRENCQRMARVLKSAIGEEIP